MADSQRHCTFCDDFSRIWCVSQWALGRFDTAAAIDGDRSFCFLLLPFLQKCQPRTSADATPRTCLIIRNQGLGIARRHHRLYLRPRCPVCHHRHHHYDPISWHPHRARESSPNNPAMRRGLAFSGPEISASPSSICTRLPAFQTSQSSCCSRRPGVSRRCIPHRRPPPRLVNTKPRNPSPGQSRRSPAAHLLTRILARRFLTCTGRRRRFALNAAFDRD